MLLPWIWLERKTKTFGKLAWDQSERQASRGLKRIQFKVPYQQWFLFPDYSSCVQYKYPAPTDKMAQRGNGYALHAPSSWSRGAPPPVALPKLFYAKRIAVVFDQLNMCHGFVFLNWFFFFFLYLMALYSAVGAGFLFSFYFIFEWSYMKQLSWFFWWLWLASKNKSNCQ